MSREAFLEHVDAILRAGGAPLALRSARDPGVNEKQRGKVPFKLRQVLGQDWSQLKWPDYPVGSLAMFEELWPSSKPHLGLNLGWRTGAVSGARLRTVVLDCDKDEARNWVRNVLGAKPETAPLVGVLTKKGMHFWLLLDESIEHLVGRVRVNIDPQHDVGLDVQASRNHVVFPPSVSGVDGTPYRLVSARDLSPLPLADWLAALAESPKFKPEWIPGIWSSDGKPLTWTKPKQVHGSVLSGAEGDDFSDVPLANRLKRYRAWLDKAAREARETFKATGKWNPTQITISGSLGQDTLMGLLAPGVWGLALPPRIVAETFHVHELNQLALDEQGQPYPWDLESPDSQGLYRKAAEAAKPEGKVEPFGYLILRGKDKAKSAQKDLDERLRTMFSVVVDNPNQVGDLPLDIPCNDAGNARRLVMRYGGRLLHSEALGWLALVNGCWIPSRDTAEKCARESAAYIGEEQAATESAGLADRAKALRKWALESGNQGRVRACLSAAESEAEFNIHFAALDRPSDWVLCRNTALNLRTRETMPLDNAGRLLATKRLGCDYISRAVAKKWEDLISTIIPDAGMRAAFQEYIGIALAGATAHFVVFLHGAGRNGKGLAMWVIRELGGDFSVCPDVEVIVGGGDVTLSGNAIQEQRATFRGARFVIPSELPESRVSAKAVKSLASTDSIRGRFLGQNSFEFTMVGKIFISCNSLPTITDLTHSIWDRVKIILFPVRFSAKKEEVDGKLVLPMRNEDLLKAELREELPGILNWAIEGYARFLAGGGVVRNPPAMTAHVNAWRDSSDVIKEFIKEKCIMEKSASCLKADLYREFRVFCRESGIPDKYIKGRNKFFEHVKDLGFAERLPGRRFFLGLGCQGAQGAPVEKEGSLEDGQFKLPIHDSSEYSCEVHPGRPG